MEKKEQGQLWDMMEVLELKPNWFWNGVKDELDDYQFSIEISVDRIESIIRDTLKAEEMETEKPETTRGVAFVRKGGNGRYYALKNIRFHCMNFLEAVMALIQTEPKYQMICGGIFLYHIIQYLGVDMSEEQTAVLMALYQMAKYYEVTDENIMDGLLRKLEERDYCELSEKEIRKRLSELIEMEAISIENGRYNVSEMLIIPIG